jgi:prepilin-type N-terminal cleavage/methylation domain-containing protein
MINMKKQHSQKGVSLVEILFVLMIAAVVTTIAIQFYAQTRSNHRVSQALTLIQQITKAGHEWLQTPGAVDGSGDQYPADFSQLPSNPLVAFKNQGLLPCENNSCQINPWGGPVTVNANASNPQYLSISLSLLPKSDCARLKESMKNYAPENIEAQNDCTSDGVGAYVYQISL